MLRVCAAGFASAARLELGVRNLFDRTYPELRAGGFIVPGQPQPVYGEINYDF